MRDPGGTPEPGRHQHDPPLVRLSLKQDASRDNWDNLAGLQVDGWLNDRPGELLDGLWSIVRPLMASHAGRVLLDRAPVVFAFLGALRQHILTTELGNDGAGPGTLVSVDHHQTPDAAGATVGLTGRRVRQLCADGLVAHDRIGARGYLVDVNDLREHLATRSRRGR